MTRVEAVAQAYCLPVADVERWGVTTVRAFYNAAVNRGWLTPEAAAA